MSAAADPGHRVQLRRDRRGGRRRRAADRANQVATQVALHAATGGIVPEVAARQQLRWIVPTLRAAMDEARSAGSDLDAVAVTYGPGLIGSLLVGVNVAKALAVAHGLPLVGVNHIEGHIYANWLTDAPAAEPLPAEPPFPLLCLVVSGGHTQLVLMHDHGRYQLLGQTVDDAAGEAFDKVGRLLGLPYPGGPAISGRGAGCPPATRFPRARTAGRYDFSFSGLKTAVLRDVAGYRDSGAADPGRRAGGRVRGGGRRRAGGKTVAAAREHGVAAVALGGGVAANRALRAVLRERLGSLPLLVPPPAWCTDNGAMIGAAGGFRLRGRRPRRRRAGGDPDLALPWLDRCSGEPSPLTAAHPACPERLAPPTPGPAAPAAVRRAAAAAPGAEPELPDRCGGARRHRGRGGAAARRPRRGGRARARRADAAPAGRRRSGARGRARPAAGRVPARASSAAVPGFELIEADALALHPREIFPGEPFKLVANIPYHITSPLLHAFLEGERPPELSGAAVQAEVAERVAAPPGGMSYLSVFVQNVARRRGRRRACRPQRSSRRPRSTRRSCACVRRDDPPVPPGPGREPFYRVVQAGFRQRRKQIHNGLGRELPIERSRAGGRAGGLRHRRRSGGPQTLSLDEWACLARRHRRAALA